MQLIQALAADKGTLEEQLLERTRSLEACMATVEVQNQQLLAAVVAVKAESQQREPADPCGYGDRRGGEPAALGAGACA